MPYPRMRISVADTKDRVVDFIVQLALYLKYHGELQAIVTINEAADKSCHAEIEIMDAE